MIKVDFCIPRSIRVKLNTECQYRCKFCHQEGNSKSKKISPDDLVSALLFLREKMGFYRVHFTGGEPTLYDNFLHLLSTTKRYGFINALTTNGQFQDKKILELKDAGLDSVNFSLHAVDPKKFLNIQNVAADKKASVGWAKNCIKKSMKNTILSNKILKTKINCVISDDIDSPQKILRFCMDNNIELRFLNDLNIGERAVDNIRKILFRNKAELIKHEITFLSSSHRLDYEIGKIYKFGVKCIRKFYLESMCKNCNLKKAGKCLEGFYGIRPEGDPLQVRLCLNKNGYPFTQAFNDFTKSEQFKEMKSKIKHISHYIKNDSIIKEQEKIKL